MGQERWFYLGSLSLVVAGCGCVGCVGGSGGCEAHLLELLQIAVVVAGLACLEEEAEDHLFALELRQQGDELGEGGLLALPQELGCDERTGEGAATDLGLLTCPFLVGGGFDVGGATAPDPSGCLLHAVHAGDGLTDGCAEANLETTTVADVRGIGRSEGGAADLPVEQGVRGLDEDVLVGALSGVGDDRCPLAVHWGC
jgi:hypothetical protein